MKKLFICWLPLFISFCFLLTVTGARAQGSVSFQIFYDQLSPYGSWVNYNPYGYVWIPTAVSAGFRPYGSSGHWVFTPDGWTWISDYNWGWAPFHYGNWFYDGTYGWMWLPGYEWAPAWVTWGEYGNDYCWAPIGPNIQIGTAWSSYRPPVHYWTFVPRTYMGRADMNRHYAHYNTNVTVINHIQVINNINSGGGRPRYMRGPQVDHVERYTHTSIRPVRVREAAGPGRGRVVNGQVDIYRPSVTRSPSGKPVVPPRVHPLQSVKPASLPGYHRNVRPARAPASRNNAAPARPAPNRQPVRPAPSGTGRTPKPAPNRRNQKPAPARPAPKASPARPAPQTNRPAPSRPAPERRAPARENPAPRAVPEQHPATPAPSREPAPAQRPERGR